MRYTYTNDDIDFLRKYYPNGDWEKIEQRFPFLSKTAIYRKCQKLNIASNNTHRKDFDNTKNRRKWTEKETKILMQNYSYIPFDDLMKLLPNRTKDMINNKAKRCNLLSYQKITSKWKDWEVEYIQTNWFLIPDVIIAKNIGRTQRAVKWKREQMGLYRQNFESFSYPTISKYLRGQNQQWKKESMENCNYKCVLTDSKSFEIHHLYGVSNIINDIFDLYPKYKDKSFKDYSEKDLSFLLTEFLRIQSLYPLGVCVDKKLHVLFHSMYGQYFNTPEQWYRFCEDYKKGVYEEYI